MSSGAVLKAPIMLNMANMVFQITNSPRSSYLQGGGGGGDRKCYCRVLIAMGGLLIIVTSQ